MLKYIKRQTSKLKKMDHIYADQIGKIDRRHNSHKADDAGTSATNLNVDDVNCIQQKRHSLHSAASFCNEVFLEEFAQLVITTPEESEVCSDSISCSAGSLNDGFLTVVNADDLFRYQSRLSMTLTSIVNEPNCLSYLVQYLEMKNALQLIKFYLDIENFKRAAIIQIEKDEKITEFPAHEGPTFGGFNGEIIAKQVYETDDEDEANENINDNDVPELKTLCDLSMRKPLTDDEKSQIFEEANKQLSKSLNINCNRLKACSELFICSGVSDSLERPISAASIKDAMAIYQKYLITNASQFVELPISILTHISLLLCKRNDEWNIATANNVSNMRPIPTSCFDEARDYVLLVLERDYLQEFLQSKFYCKYCLELIDNKSITIYDVLYSEVTLFYFMEFLEQHNDREFLDFWSAAINFRKSFDTNSHCNENSFKLEEVKADAMIIYERFFSLQSESRLSMTDKLRCHVEQCICAPDQVIYAFDLPLQVTARYLNQKYFREFLKSQLFVNYLNELKTKTQNVKQTEQQHKDQIKEPLTQKFSFKHSTKKSTQAPLHRKSMSDCTYTNISQHNTLLASRDMPKPANMNIDARQLTNPNLLWQRYRGPNGNVGLKFGSVNSMGRYERDFEAVDSVALKQNWSFSMSGNKIKNAMRKLVNLPEDKMQEEIAWQVAEMIVKDVTSVTLQSSKNLTF